MIFSTHAPCGPSPRSEQPLLRLVGRTVGRSKGCALRGEGPQGAWVEKIIERHRVPQKRAANLIARPRKPALPQGADQIEPVPSSSRKRDAPAVLAAVFLQNLALDRGTQLARLRSKKVFPSNHCAAARLHLETAHAADQSDCLSA
jgi:hypothetical protein